ncbi:MAG: hypothetical protein ACRCX8_01520 [Sarcina sp.]
MTVRELIEKLTEIQAEHGGHIEVSAYDSMDGEDLGTFYSVHVGDDGTCLFEL